MALINTKGYNSKNHLATILILIKEFYGNDLSKNDLTSLAKLLDYQEVLFYVEAKNRREDTTYSTNILYSRKDVESLRLKTILLVSKIKALISN